MIYLIRNRIAVTIPTLILVLLIVFLLQRLLPGDLAVVLSGEDRSEEVIAFLREKYRLDDPLIVQFWNWLVLVLQGDLGSSTRTGVPVATTLWQKFPVTLQLAGMAFLVTVAIGLPLGVLAAVFKDTAIDTTANIFALSGLSIPNFWLGIILIMIFSVELRLLPASGYVPLTEDFWLSVKTMILPAIVLGTALAGSLMRHCRSAMISVLESDYIRTARSKGLSERVVIFKHALRNALVPIVTMLALIFGELMSGAVLTEQIFSIPGFGKLLVDSVFNRDFPIVQGIVLITALVYILMNFFADVLYVVINPRLRER